MKAGMLSEIRSEFPLKAVSDGEETYGYRSKFIRQKNYEICIWYG